MNRKQLRRMIMSAINEHRIAPSLNLPGVPQSHIDKIHELISAGELEQAQSLIDAFGGPPNYARDYAAYEEVGDLEKLGNKAADIMSSVPKTERGWSTMSDMQPVYDVDKEAYDSVRRKIDRGELDADLTWDRNYMSDRYFNIRNSTLGGNGNNTFFDHRGDKSPTYFDDDGNPLNEHNSIRPRLRRMILQELFLFHGAKKPSKHGHEMDAFASALRLHARSYPGSYVEVGVDDYGVTISSSMNAFDPVTLQAMLDDNYGLRISGPGGLSGRFNNPYEAAEIILSRLLGGY